MDSGSFESRMGLPERKFEVQRQLSSNALRQAIWNWLYMTLWKPAIGHTTDAMNQRQYVKRFCQDFWVMVLNGDVSRISSFSSGVIDNPAYLHLHKQCMEGPWWFPYRLVEFFINHKSVYSGYIADLETLLERYGSAYRLIEGRFVEITTEEQVQAVNAALTAAEPPVRAHLIRAMDLIGSIEQPDYRNSIKESISAVEACCRAIAGKKSATLADALKRIEGVHPVLSEAFKKLYGYTSDESGIRHALSQDDRVTHADAMFMLVACSAFISYLNQNVAAK